MTRGGIYYAKLRWKVIFGVVGWLSDYRTSLSLKGKRLFHTKNTRLFNDDSQGNATTITLRLSAYSKLLYYI
nr:MAG TPA: hypothetical protein [Caudoviricetes sp.]